MLQHVQTRRLRNAPAESRRAGIAGWQTLIEVAGQEGEVGEVDFPVVVEITVEPLRATGLVKVRRQKREVGQINIPAQVGVAAEGVADEDRITVHSLSAEGAAAVARLRSLGITNSSGVPVEPGGGNGTVDADAVPRASVVAADGLALDRRERTSAAVIDDELAIV